MEADIHVDKLAYALALLDGARRISDSAMDEPISTIGIPFYLLIGFSIENSLKAFLEYKNCEGNWQRSHDLAGLLLRARQSAMQLPQEVEAFIENLSPFHKEYWFRYPEKAGSAYVYPAATALFAADALLVVAFDLTATADKF